MKRNKKEINMKKINQAVIKLLVMNLAALTALFALEDIAGRDKKNGKRRKIK